MKEVLLSRGLVALVDDDDFPLICGFKWHAARGRSLSEVWYACACLGKAQALQFGKRHVKLHRLLMGFPNSPLKVDHRNGNGLDNRRENLRIVNANQSQMNRPANIQAVSQYKGVSWHKRSSRWQSQICAYGHHRYIGEFANEIEAALAYDREAILIHGEYARLNFSRKEVRKRGLEPPRPLRTLGPEPNPKPSDQDDAKATTGCS